MEAQSFDFYKKKKIGSVSALSARNEPVETE